MRTFAQNNNVAPYAGAWIETPIAAIALLANLVAPYAGAWIETLMLAKNHSSPVVAPYAGAWIETRSACCSLFL